MKANPILLSAAKTGSAVWLGTGVSPLVTLDRLLRDLPGAAGLEAWLGMHLVARLPGGDDARA